VTTARCDQSENSYRSLTNDVSIRHEQQNEFEHPRLRGPNHYLDQAWPPRCDRSGRGVYRVDEVLGGVNVTAVGRSNEITGSLTIEGTTASVVATVEVENIVSNDSIRDGQFRGRIMDVSNFPTANFGTTEPIDFGTLPAGGEQVAATANGELTLKGVTQVVTVEIAAQASGTGIGVLGNIPITFTDYGIDNPSKPGVGLEDEGVVEFVLVFERA
jgi:polyisoprenoid-binding protein YceI